MPIQQEYFYPTIIPTASCTKSPKSTGPMPSPLRAGFVVVVVRFCRFNPPMSHQSTPPVRIG
jgi:hypothetical protein